MLFLTRQRRIFKDGIDFKQIDKEWHWYGFANFLGPSSIIATEKYPLNFFKVMNSIIFACFHQLQTKSLGIFQVCIGPMKT
jgi:hypothetical protein